MSNEQKLREALRIAESALADIGDADREPGDDLAWCERRAAQDLPTIRQALATTEPEPTGMPDRPTLPRCTYPNMQYQRRHIGNVYTADQMRAYGEQCWKAGYKHGAWGGDAKDAERYRWLRDIAPTLGNRAPHVTQYPGQSFDKITYLDATKVGLDAAIDAAMAQGVKG